MDNKQKVNQMEDKLDEMLNKKAPFSLPESGRKMIVQYLPWLVLIGAILMLLGALNSFRLLMWATDAMNYAASFGYSYGYGSWSLVGWLSLGFMVIEAIMMLAAFPPLKDRKKQGWNLLFWVSILSAVFAVVQLILTMNIGSLVFSLIGLVIGLFILFQIRSYYNGVKTEKIEKKEESKEEKPEEKPQV